MSFLNSISIYFPELSQLHETYPTNYATAKSALDDFYAISRDLHSTIKNYRKPLSDLEMDYVKELNKRVEALEIRFKSAEKKEAKEIKKQAEGILEGFINPKESDLKSNLYIGVRT